ncbi:glycosyltransferase family 2 protein [Salinibacter ruber]|jgi:glycosyltransferase involved in cell wall biosynthesis|uniref:glycosyltransferase family 2 protein n=1 Tax=Salinibacter ruber TaxID=146919 RepID=UPI002166E0A0|nr:glycosyltransferase family A protein [Salinibacter ruber]MCS3643324.1 glycosyltransferase involved in cell wall biosynthesis [Salinibacter ruber]
MSRLVSIVINNYNYEDYVEYALKSAIAQTHNNIEIVVVDDGSTDGSRIVIEEFESEVQAIFKENGGQASAINVGFEASSGDLVLFLDADDYLQPEAIERAVNTWEPEGAKVQFRLQCVDGEGQRIEDFVKPRWVYAMPNGNVVPTLRREGGYVMPPTSGNVFSREVLTEILPIPTDQWSLCADAYLNLSAPFHGTIQSIDDTLGYYRVHGKNAWQDISAERDVLLHRTRVHLQKQNLVAQLTGEQNGHRSFYPDSIFARDRFASFLLYPEGHPVPEENRLRAISYGLCSTWKTDGIGWGQRLKLILGYIGAGVLPRLVAKPILRNLLS